MLKRSGTLLLLLLYFITSIGFAVNVHYCGKLITSVKIDGSLISCKERGMMPGMKCCKNKHIGIKLKDVHQAQTHSFLGKLFSLKVFAINFASAHLLPQAFLHNHSYYRGPPYGIIDATLAFIKNCTFRI